MIDIRRASRFGGRLLFLALCAAFFGAAPAHSTGVNGDLESCFRAAARKYSMNFYLVAAIGRHESRFAPKAVNTANYDGSEDIGIMMINSSWLPKLSQYNITRQRLLDEPCLNIHVGTWILANTLAERGTGWHGVGYYNAISDLKRERYVSLIKEELRLVYAHYGVARSVEEDPTIETGDVGWPKAGMGLPYVAVTKKRAGKNVAPARQAAQIVIAGG